MTREEFNGFTRSLFAAFPGINKFLRDSCLDGDPVPTLNVWFRQLSDITLAEAMNVLAGWIDGTQKPLEAYEREKTAAVIRAISLNERDKAAKRNRTNEIGDEYARTKRGNRKPLAEGIPELATIYAKVHELNRLFAQDAIDEQERKRRINEFARGANERVSGVVEE